MALKCRGCARPMRSRMWRRRGRGCARWWRAWWRACLALVADPLARAVRTSRWTALLSVLFFAIWWLCIGVAARPRAW